MGIVHVGRIKAAIKKRFESLIDLSDVKPSASAEERESTLLTRCLSAFAIAELARVDDKIAAKAVVDGYGDNGIDALYYDVAEATCYIVQSKWHHEGKGTIDLGDTLKFVKGIRELLNFDLGNFDKLKHKATEIEAALTNIDGTFVTVVVHTGEQKLAPGVQQPLDAFLAEQNDVTELLKLRALNQFDLHSIVAQQATGATIKFNVMLREWGRIVDPHLAYYGQVEIEDVARWKEFGQQLYSKNLRGFKGSTDVNEGIVHTARNNPQNFFYFNNGITIVCDRLSKLPQGGSNRESGVFECDGASVVNGAQTVGSIISAVENGPNGFHNARVLVRLISLEKCEPRFGPELTRAANTQNRIEKKDFAAQDPEQERLKTDLFLDCGKTYAFRTGDPIPAPDEGCILDDAAIALACAQSDLGLCVQAKREVSRLWENIEQPPYTILFNNGLSAFKLWRAVEVLRLVDMTLKNAQATLAGRERLIAVHGNRFVLHRVFREIKTLEGTAVDFDKEKQGVASIAQAILARTIAATQALFSSSYPANVFKSASKCKDLTQQILSPMGGTPGSQLGLI